MNEGTFKRYVLGRLSHLYKHSNTYASLSGNGIPDHYFDGSRDLWVEFKYVAAIPRNGLVGGVDDKKRGCYSTRQYRWMLRRHGNGRNAWGVVALPNRTAVIQTEPEEWLNKSSIRGAVPWAEVAARISHYCEERA